MNDREKFSLVIAKLKGIRSTFDRIGDGLENIQRRLGSTKKQNLVQTQPQNENRFDSGDGPKPQIDSISTAATYKTMRINGQVRCLSKEGQKVVVAVNSENANVITKQQSKIPMRTSKMTFSEAKALCHTAVLPLKGILKAREYSDSYQDRKSVTFSLIKPVDSISARTKQILSKIFQPKCSSGVEVKTDRIVPSSQKNAKVVPNKRDQLSDMNSKCLELISLCNSLELSLSNENSSSLGKNCVSSMKAPDVFRKGYVSELVEQFAVLSSGVKSIL